MGLFCLFLMFFLKQEVFDSGILDLSHRGLRAIPKWVWKLSKLRVLKLDHNEIREINIPKKHRVRKEALRVIDVSYNKIEELPPYLMVMVTEEFELLDVSFNQLSDIPEELYNLVMKQELRIEVEGTSYWTNRNNCNLLDANWGGYHGKKPKGGEYVYGRHSYVSKAKIVFGIEDQLRIKIEGNVELENTLRYEIYWFEDFEQIPAIHLRDHLLDVYLDKKEQEELEKQKREEEIPRKVLKVKKKKMQEHEILSDGFKRRSDLPEMEKDEMDKRKEKKNREREKKKKNKDKAIRREGQENAKRKAFIE